MLPVSHWSPLAEASSLLQWGCLSSQLAPLKTLRDICVVILVPNSYNVLHGLVRRAFAELAIRATGYFLL